MLDTPAQARMIAGMLRKLPLSTPAPEDLRTGVVNMLALHGEARTCHLLHLSKTTIARVVGRETVRRATVTHLRHLLLGHEMLKPEPQKKPEPVPPTPLERFIGERCTLGLFAFVELGKLYGEWARWCESQGGKASVRSVFARDLLALRVGIRVSRPRTHSGRGRVYLGVGLKPLPLAVYASLVRHCASCQSRAIAA